MPVCETCGNNYDKASFRSWSGANLIPSTPLSVHPSARANMRALRMSRHRTRCGSQLDRLLLRPLREPIWLQRNPRSRLGPPALSRNREWLNPRRDAPHSLEVQQ